MYASNEESTEIVENLFNKFADRLYTFAVNAWKFSEDDAWDTIYETLFHIAKVYHRYAFPDEKKLTNFVITVFNNRLKNHQRDKQVRRIHIQYENVEEEIAAIETGTPLSALEQMVSEALDELEDWERILLIQRSLLVPYSDIEKLVGKPEQQLKVYYKRSLTKLEKKIKAKLSMEHSHDK